MAGCVARKNKAEARHPEKIQIQDFEIEKVQFVSHTKEIEKRYKNERHIIQGAIENSILICLRSYYYEVYVYHNLTQERFHKCS